jgi:hypothetical protein
MRIRGFLSPIVALALIGAVIVSAPDKRESDAPRRVRPVTVCNPGI